MISRQSTIGYCVQKMKLDALAQRVRDDYQSLPLSQHDLGFGTFLDQAVKEFQREIQISAFLVCAYLCLLAASPFGLAPVIFAGTVQDAFKHNRARKNVIVAGGLILVCITLLSCVSSFMIYREGFSDTPWLVQQSLSLFAVIVVEGAFIWLVYGFTRAFSSLLERLISLAGMAFLVCVMLCNIITHFMMVKRLPLNDWQQGWLAWGAVSVFIAVLIFVLLITLSDPVTRLIRLELRYLGKQEETILQAKSDGLDSEHVQLAMIERAEIEAQELASQIIGAERRLPRGASSRLYQQPQRAYLKKGRDQSPQGKDRDNWI